MDLSVAFAPDVGPDVFFSEMFPQIFATHAEGLAQVSDLSLVVGVRFEDDDDLEWTFTLSGEGAEVEEGEGDDPPLLTLVGIAAYWDMLRGELHELFKTLDKLAAKGRSKTLPKQFRLTQKRYDALVRLGGHFKLELTGVPGADASVPATIIIGDFYDPGEKGVTINLAFEDFQQVVRGQLSPGRLRAQKKVKITGDLKFPMSLAGIYMAS